MENTKGPWWNHGVRGRATPTLGIQAKSLAEDLFKCAGNGTGKYAASRLTHAARRPGMGCYGGVAARSPGTPWWSGSDMERLARGGNREWRRLSYLLTAEHCHGAAAAMHFPPGV